MSNEESPKSSEREALERIAKAIEYDVWAHEANIASAVESRVVAHSAAVQLNTTLQKYLQRVAAAAGAHDFSVSPTRMEQLLEAVNDKTKKLIEANKTISFLQGYLVKLELAAGMGLKPRDVFSSTRLEGLCNTVKAFRLRCEDRNNDVEVGVCENSYRHPRQAHFEELKQAVVDYEQLFVDSFGAHPSGKEPRDVVAHVCIQHVMEGKNGYLYFWEGKLMLCFVAYREKWDVLNSADTWKVSELNEDLMGPVAAHIKHLYLKLLKRDSDVCDRLALQAKSLREEITERRKVLEKRVSR
jgi:hypothetical protein